MSSFSVNDIKQLRQATGAGMMDCKNALAENSGDMEASIDWLRKKGLLKAAKKSQRVAAEGLVGVAVIDNEGCLVEINSETDFVARNEKFQELVKHVTLIGITCKGNKEAILKSQYADQSITVEEKITELISVIGENITLRRSVYMHTQEGVLASYLHNAIAEGIGRIGILCALKGDNKEACETQAKSLAMHIAAAQPLAMRKEDIADDIIQKEKAIYMEQAQNSGKPEHVIEKLIEGQLRKFYEQSVLPLQVHVVDGKKTVEHVLKESGNLVIEGFERFFLGEGIEKDETSFSDEVNAMASGN